jgi:hypothetical protein
MIEAGVRSHRLGRVVLMVFLLWALGPLPLLVGWCRASTLSTLNVDFVGRGGGTAGLAARTDDVDNVVWNASGLAFGTGRTVFGGFMDYLVGLKGGAVGYVDRTSPNIGYGLWASYLSSGSLTRTDFDDPTGEKGATFAYTDVVCGVAAAYSVLPFLGLGTGLKVARQDMEGFSTSGLFGDVSVTFKAYAPDPRTNSRPQIYTSYTTRNIELARWEQDVGAVPRNSEVAMALAFPDPNVTTGLSFYIGEAGRREIRLGIEAAPSDEFEARLGYRRRTGHMSDQANDLPWERGLMAGFGVRFGSVWIDYTFEDASPLDNVHRFGVRAAIHRPELN